MGPAYNLLIACGLIGYVILLWDASRIFQQGNPANNALNKAGVIIVLAALPLAAILNAVGVGIFSGGYLDYYFVFVFAYYVLKVPLWLIYLSVDGLRARNA